MNWRVPPLAGLTGCAPKTDNTLNPSRRYVLLLSCAQSAVTLTSRRHFSRQAELCLLQIGERSLQSSPALA